jgi:hypothetical protein
MLEEFYQADGDTIRHHANSQSANCAVSAAEHEDYVLGAK